MCIIFCNSFRDKFICCMVYLKYWFEDFVDLGIEIWVDGCVGWNIGFYDVVNDFDGVWVL